MLCPFPQLTGKLLTVGNVRAIRPNADQGGIREVGAGNDGSFCRRLLVAGLQRTDESYYFTLAFLRDLAQFLQDVVFVARFLRHDAYPPFLDIFYHDPRRIL